jgi:hypothetical protein
MLTAHAPAAPPGSMRLPVLTPPALATNGLVDATVLDEPHVWLGLPADETCPGRIAAAARKRLDAIRDAGGTDDAVKEAVIAIIVAARQALLARANS